MVFVFQQFTGQIFVSQYSPRFYKAVGLSAHAFEYNIISAVVAWVGVLIGMPLSDLAGRRDLLIWGAVLQGIFLFAMAGVGTKSNYTTPDANGLVASVMLFNFFFAMCGFQLIYEFPSLIDVTNKATYSGLGLQLPTSVVAAFIVAFCVPYLLDGIEANIGWVFGALSFIAAIYSYFCVPEVKNQARGTRLIIRGFFSIHRIGKFASTQTHGAGRVIAEIENRVTLRTGAYHGNNGGSEASSSSARQEIGFNAANGSDSDVEDVKHSAGV
ncbi:hypothetical protein UA08_00660 [Talaromyces atroroseus]|uniref:Major facilitator superfamily (MFS) profile domain-containing protein n=1 Tax=Talaromyces atroroseus TaxID=1441469 RepID=A0A225BER7_TALAT|nr:hypothetical protein UA08_00660 [Talaromyces atroroseus]OKL64537.1 hypothetical protein UA08_00660 [Talaromyces atroroseus]